VVNGSVAFNAARDQPHTGAGKGQMLRYRREPYGSAG
jgi:hypothetical protein